ncbi:MAG: hypothetical protein AB1429_04360 [Pseudomonadota bacterium]|jgi:hypothetical protein
MTLDVLIRLLFLPAAATFAAMAAANLAIMIARLSHHQELAQAIARTTSRWSWFLRLGE